VCLVREPATIVSSNMMGSQLQWRMYIENAFQLAVELLNVLVDGRRLVEDVEW